MLKSCAFWMAWIAGVTLAASLVRAESHKFRVSDPALAQSLLADGATLVADYGGFKVIETKSGATPAAAVAGANLADLYDRIQLNGKPLDTRRPEIQALRRPVATFAGKRLHLIQFAGPVKPEWFAAMQECGVRVVNSVPQNAYLVYGDAAALSRLQKWAGTVSYVQWDGDYAEDYRIHPLARAAARPQNSWYPRTDKFAVQLVEDTNANPATLALIDRLKLGPLDSTFRVLHFVNVIVRLHPAQLEWLAARPDVVFIHPFLEPRKLDERQDQIIAGNLSGGAPTGPGYLAWLAAKGFSQSQFDASGFLVDVSDSGIESGTNAPGHFGLYQLGNPALSNRVAYSRLEGTPNVGSTLAGCDGHGTLNAHIIAGYSDLTGFPFADSAGYRYGLGVCPFVSVGASVIFDPRKFTYPNFADLQSRAYENGARISANSWGNVGSAGAYDVYSQAYDALVRDAQPEGSAFATSNNQPMVIVFSAGNAWSGQSVEAPGTAKNVITVGASESVRSLTPAHGGNSAWGNDGCGIADYESDNAEDMAGFSSRGPCADGRKKPDLVAPGTHITGGVAQESPPSTNGTGSALACFDAENICALIGRGTPGSVNNFFPTNQQYYSVSSGTSHSTPAVAGACALLRQHFINQSLAAPSPAMTKACLMNAARYLSGTGANDNLWSVSQGMGALDLGRAFDDSPRILRDQVSENKFTSTGQFRTFTGTIDDPGKPFRVTLAWTDAPGTPSAQVELLNDLDLTVTVGGTSYKGNVFSGQYSTTGGSEDTLNNVESVFLPPGSSGSFVITVTAANITSDGVPNESPALDQDFALVVYNAQPTWVPIMALESAHVTAENCPPPNGAIDPGETVTVAFTLRNIGTGSTTNLVAALLQTNGVALPNGPHAYGVIAPDATATQAFAFTAFGSCGDFIHPTLQLQDGPVNLGQVSTAAQLGSLTLQTITLTNPTNVQIPQSDTSGPGSPYPSDIVISGTTGIIAKVTVTLFNLSHEWSQDLDFLLAGPSGTNVMLLSWSGFGSVSNATLTFDDSAAFPLPQSTEITSGSYLVSGYYADDENLPAPAPPAPFGQNLAVFNGSDPNGTWSLYTLDNAEGSVGHLAGGWQLSITGSNLVCCAGAMAPPPQIQSLLLTNGTASVTWTAFPGQTYRLQYNTSLSDTTWSNVVPDIVATNFTACMSNVVYPTPKCFYRVLAVN